MNYIVLDLEWNQCPAGKAREVKELPFEIIEIGAVRLDASRQIVDQFHEIVKPHVYKSLHYRTQEIVQLRAIDFDDARPFPKVVVDFLKWCWDGTGEPDFCTWGPSDLTELQRNLSFYDIPAPFPYPLMYFDIQKIFSIVYEDRKSRRSLEYAVDFLNIPKEIPFHSALSDASYTSLIMQRLENDQIRENSSVDYYRLPRSRKEEICLHYSTYDKFISKPFPSREQAMKDPILTTIRCPICSNPTQKKIRWFTVGSHNQLALAFCPNHGYIKGKIRLRQNAGGKTYAIRTTKPISEEDAYQIYEKKEVQKVKRQLRRQFDKEELHRE